MDERVPVRITFGIRTVTEDDCEIKKINFNFGCSSESFLTIGSTFSPTCTVEMENRVFILQSVHFVVEFYNAITEQWDNYGEYMICDMPVVTDGIVSFVGKGKLSCIGERVCSNSLLYNAQGRTARTLSDFATLIYNNTGIEVVNESGDNPQIYFPISDSPGVTGPEKSYRYVIGFLALQVGGVAVEYMGKVHIVQPFQYASQATVTEDEYFEFQHYDVPIHIGQVSVVCRPCVLNNDVAFYSTSEESDGSITYTYGSTDNGRSAISVELDAAYNPMLICETAFASLDYEYNAGSVKIYGNKGIMPSGFVSVVSGDETFRLYCMTVNLEWDGGFTTYIETQTQSDDVGTSSLPQTLTQADIRQIVVSLKYAEFEALYVRNLEAINVAISGKLSANAADLRYADIQLANVAVADLGILLARIGLLDRATIVEGHVTGFLDAVEVNANSITAGTLTTDRLIIRGNDRSIIFAINNITGALQQASVETINGEVLTERTIAANKIIAQSITATELDVDNIFSTNAVIQQIVSQQLFAEAVSTNEVVVGAVEDASEASQAIQELSVGARNLYIGTKDFSGDRWINDGMYPSEHLYPMAEEDWKYKGYDVAVIEGGVAGISQLIQANTGDVYTLSCYAWCDGGTVVAKAAVEGGASVSDGNQTVVVTNEWTRISATFHITSDGNIALRFEQSNTANNLYVCALKAERGNKPTDYTPAPEDFEYALDDIKGDLLNWCVNNNLTYIDGAKIYTRSVKAIQVDIEDLFAQDITATGTIRGATVIGGTVEGGVVNGATVTGSTVIGTNMVGGNIKSINYDSVNGAGMEIDLINGSTNSCGLYQGLVYKNGLWLEESGIAKLRMSSGKIDMYTYSTQESAYHSTSISALGIITESITATSLNVSGPKSRIAKTKNYGIRKLYCYETPEPLFGDMGNAKLDANGICYIQIDEVFAETIDTECSYVVQLTKYGQGEVWVDERNSDFFVVKGTPNLEFSWVLSAIQKGFDDLRLEEYTSGKEK